MSDALLRKIYYDVSNPASFGSVDKLFREANSRDSRITRDDVERFLSGELAYTLHRKIVRRFPRNPVVSNFHTELAQADLIDVSRYARSNSNNKFILTLIDVFSKMAFAVPIKNKAAATVADAFRKIFSTGYQPLNLQTDEGKEFVNKTVQDLLKEHSILFYTAKNKQIKCAVIERFQRTLMSRVSKYFTANNTKKYLDVLPDLMNAYNNTYHRSIKMTPMEATKDENKELVFKNLYGFRNYRQLLQSKINKKNAKLYVGKSVRVPKMKHVFEKGYRQNFSDEIFKIRKRSEVYKRPVYALQTLEGVKIPRTFYSEELVPVVDGED